MKTSETKRFLRGIFEFKNIFCLSHPGIIFIFSKEAF
jgi:hypothetical protein